MNSPFIIRPAHAGDAQPITELVNDAYSPYIPRIGRKPGPMLDDYARLIAEAAVFVLEEGDEIAGILVMEREHSELVLLNVAVLPRYKGQGIGKQLMGFCEDYARDNGCTAIRLYTHALMTENLGIYCKLGYQETHRATQDGFDRVFMRKAL